MAALRRKGKKKSMVDEAKPDAVDLDSTIISRIDVGMRITPWISVMCVDPSQITDRGPPSPISRLRPCRAAGKSNNASCLGIFSRTGACSPIPALVRFPQLLARRPNQGKPPGSCIVFINTMAKLSHKTGFWHPLPILETTALLSGHSRI